MNENVRKILKKVLYGIIAILLIIIFISLSKKIYIRMKSTKEMEGSVISFKKNNEKTIFSIDKIVFFSSSDTKSKTSSQSNFTIENLYAYTDMALFINNNSKENTLENTLKNVKISNIKLTKNPTVGEPDLYYKDINNFAKGEINEENKIEEYIEFDVTSENEADLSKPVLYNNCANPITLSYINKNIKKDYTITDTINPITYDGALLKRCGVPINTIETAISFEIEIENNKNQKFKNLIYFDIPYQNDEKSIYDGNLTLKKDTKFDFYRYE